MQTNHIDRRKALTVVAAAPAAFALGAVLTPAVTKAAPHVYKFGIGEGPRSFVEPVLTDLYEPEFPKGSIAIIDPDLAPEDGDLVLVRLRWETFPDSIGLLPFWKTAGHDEHGRFCCAGDPREVVAHIGPIAYTREEFARFVQIQGTARGCVVHSKSA
jgi:hypothetical protein